MLIVPRDFHTRITPCLVQKVVHLLSAKGGYLTGAVGLAARAEFWAFFCHFLRAHALARMFAVGTLVWSCICSRDCMLHTELVSYCAVALSQYICLPALCCLSLF